MKLRDSVSGLESIIHGLSKGVNRISMVVLFCMMLLVGVDVIGRFLFNHPIKGSTEITELMMVIVVYLAIGYCTMKKSQVTVDIVTSRLSGSTLAIFNSITDLASLIIFSFIFWQITQRGISELLSTSGRVTPLAGIPEAPFLLVISLGCLLVCLEMLIFFSHSLMRLKIKPRG